MLRIATTVPWLTIVLILAAGIFWWWSTRYLGHRAPVWVVRTIRVIRAAGLLTVILLLMDFQVLWNVREEVEPTVSLYVDRSRSTDSHSEALRDSAARLLDLLEDRGLHTELHTFADTLLPVDNPGQSGLEGYFTDLSIPLQDLREGRTRRNIHSAIILSDGAHNRGVSPESVLGEVPVPVYSLFVGDSVTRPDLALNRSSIPNVVYAGDTIQAVTEMQIRDLRDSLRASLSVTIAGERETEDSLLLSPGNYNREVTLPIHFERPGEYQVTLSLEGDLKEGDRTNNRLQRYVKVRPGRYRVLFLGTAPSFENRFLNQAAAEMDRFTLSLYFTNLSRDQDLSTLLRSADILYVDGVPDPVSAGLPDDVNPDSLRGIISQIGSEGDLWLIEDGAISARGWSEEAVRLTTQSPNPLRSLEGTPVPWGELPPVWNAQWGSETIMQTGSPLLTGSQNGVPVVTVSEGGGRRQVFIGARSLWRWSFATGGTGAESNIRNGVYPRALEQLFYWLLQDQETDRLQVRLEQRLRAGIGAEAQVFNYAMQPVDVARLWGEVIDSTGSVVYRSSYTREGTGYAFQSRLRRSGTYQLRTIAYTGRDTLTEVSGEVQFTLPEYEQSAGVGNPQMLEQISQGTGADLLAAVSDFPAERFQDRPVVYHRESRSFHLRKIPWILVIVVMLFGVDWWLRRRYGLL